MRTIPKGRGKYFALARFEAVDERRNAADVVRVRKQD
jgi:hypothetical protein